MNWFWSTSQLLLFLFIWHLRLAKAPYKYKVQDLGDWFSLLYRIFFGRHTDECLTWMTEECFISNNVCSSLFFVLYKPPEQLGRVEQDTHLHIGKCSRDLTFLHFGALSLAQDGTFRWLQQSTEADWNGMDWNVFLNCDFSRTYLWWRN